ncbi:preprotein translocase subunit SecA [Frigoribacterium sp. CFBP 13729]|uniref:preprotein translocase subunit SecA n=1 Tax=Frigoribacterium sp. CFBP 13729 TaxID=2775293 RepID=UPI00177BAFA0|nr:preprotein translocase subunit SecA [Frigoribacterium sp. CFBP 13729]MBD8612014.1 preprotein translocase subunit SecA [Frigoribacterium sp. CFBP 13729]
MVGRPVERIEGTCELADLQGHEASIFPDHDVHRRAIERGLQQGTELLASLDPESPLDDLDGRIEDHLNQLGSLLAAHDPIEVIEQTRLAALPWNWKQLGYQAGVEIGFSIVELMSVAAMTNMSQDGSSREPAASIIDMSLDIIERLFDLGMLRSVLAANFDDPLALIQARVQASELTIRGSSYMELAEETNSTLFASDGLEEIVLDVCGFTFFHATTVLSAIHSLQVENTQRRLDRTYRDVRMEQQRHESGSTATESREKAARSLISALNPNAAAASVSLAELVTATGLDNGTVDAVLQAFSWTPDASLGLKEHARLFLRGSNPLRATPILRTPTGRAMLPHPALTQDALRETLEAKLRASTAWEKYQKHRGEVLETRTRSAIDRLLSPTRSWHGLNYYIPATQAEEVDGPDAFTKRVEGDHLILVDDVALIIEDKAVSLSSSSRSGLGSRLQKDLTGIITKAAGQADRLVQRIASDNGIRIDGEGWLDLRHIKEIHTIAVSLDDLGSTTTATADLVQAGLIKTESIPWTVSIHDLDLIAELTTRPAEFLLYLRRRRHPLATVMFTAPDELDLYLYFLSKGLYVEEDPEQLRSTFKFLPPATEAEKRKWIGQGPTYVTSQTDPLDAWYQESVLPQRAGRQPRPNAARKPSRGASPMESLLDEIDTLSPFGKVSIGATLLTGSSDTQTLMSGYGPSVVRRSHNGLKECTQTVPISTPDDGGWVMVWAVCPANDDPAIWEQKMRAYLRAKGHQLGVRRSALFAFSGEKPVLDAVFYEAIPSELDPLALSVSTYLRPASEMVPANLVPQSRRGQRAQPVRKNRKH